MPRNSAALLGLVPALALGVSAPAAAAPYNPDPLTVSGRFEAPRAVEGPLKAGIRVTGASLGEADAQLLGGAPDKVQPGLKGALEASLRNFGYLAPADSAGAVTLEVALDPFEVTPDATGVFVVARYRITAKGAAAHCVPTIAEARYHALAQLEHKGPQRAGAWVVVIGMAALGYNAGQYLADQYATARASDRAVNARRERSESEGVAPAPGEKVMKRYAAVNATQLAAADLIRQLGKGACPTEAQAQAPALAPAPDPAPAPDTAAPAPAPTTTAPTSP